MYYSRLQLSISQIGEYVANRAVVIHIIKIILVRMRVRILNSVTIYGARFNGARVPVAIYTLLI